ncbi:ABC transporter permease [Marinobacterium arenosum]|uniref:ABC transporter permease n=1 Tax=Marinobacterium arenosum TaxID=2862496 RepID=UPI001C97C6D1|nr:ABC transporter permease [Marinobacterium arenosum]MBY4675111.1 ABC transporter permease [Marinobacterium arenosum]
MKLVDQLHFNLQLLRRHRLRTGLLLLSITVGVASVIMLTSLGEGARRYVEQEFSSLGNQLLIVLPGRTETTGGAPPIYGTTPRDLTIADAEALGQLPGISRFAPIIAGTGRVSYRSFARDVITIGTNADFFPVRRLSLSLGQGLPADAASLAAPVCVLGARLKRELFGNANPINQWLRIGDYRYRVVGVLAERGESLGLDMRDMAIIPLRSAEALFNSPGLFRVLLEMKPQVSQELIKDRVRQTIRRRHEGEDDVTLISQDSVLSAFNEILTTLTAAVAAIASISLIVAGVLIMNISLISVSQRRAEIGLLKALGASGAAVRQLFIGEALMLAAVGTLIGIAVGEAVVALALRLFPDFPLAAPWWAELAAALIAIGCGLLFSWYPANKAAGLDPVRAMRGEPR